MLSNSNITNSDIEASVPSFLPLDMDEFTYDRDGGTCILKYNVNRILVENKSNPAVLPFH